MAETEVLFYKDDGGSVPVLDWIDVLSRTEPKVVRKVLARIDELRMFGAKLRRPIADYLDGGIYELRISHQHVNYRILYAFVGQNITLLTNGLVKEKRVPPAEIALAQARKRAYESNPSKHYHKE